MIVEPLIAAAVSIISVLVAVLALLPARAKMTGGKNSKEAAEKKPPQDPAVKTAQVIVEEIKEERLEEVKDAASGEDPADDLASLGNRRKRR